MRKGNVLKGMSLRRGAEERPGNHDKEGFCNAAEIGNRLFKRLCFQHEYEAIEPQVKTAHQLLMTKTGMGNDFLGWVTLPKDYDKEEFARIKAAAKRIQGNSDVFVVIGIGGSYLGARAAIEFLKSDKYNDLRKDTPAIYFAL